MEKIDIHNYGYHYEAMLPMCRKRAIAFYNADFQIYRLFPNNSECEIKSREDITQAEQDDYLFGIELDDLMNRINRVKNDVTQVLYKRWMACYLIYDLNMERAGDIFRAKEAERCRSVYESLGDVAPLTDKLIAKAYNKVLLRDIEESISYHMDCQKCDRAVVEYEITEKLACFFYDKAASQQKEGKEK